MSLENFYALKYYFENELTSDYIQAISTNETDLWELQRNVDAGVIDTKETDVYNLYKDRIAKITVEPISTYLLVGRNTSIRLHKILSYSKTNSHTYLYAFTTTTSSTPNGLLVAEQLLRRDQIHRMKTDYEAKNTGHSITISDKPIAVNKFYQEGIINS